MAVTGPDVSHHQGDVDMNAVAHAGHLFVGIKSTEGVGYLDPQFTRNRAMARAAGLFRLLYHFARPSHNDAVAEARSFAHALGTLEPGEIAVLDIEDDRVRPGQSLVAWCNDWLNEVDRLTNRGGETGAIVYTYGAYAHEHLAGGAGALDKRPLWLAAYVQGTPKSPPPWPGWKFWQHTSSGTCPGINGRVDLNRFDGDIRELRRISGMAAPAPAPKKEQPVYQVTIDATPDGVVAEFVNPYGVTMPVEWRFFRAATAREKKGAVWAHPENTYSPDSPGGTVVHADPAQKVEVAFV